MARSMCCWRGQRVFGAICRRTGYQASVRQKNNLSAELIMLVTSVLIAGMGCGIALATSAGGRPVYHRLVVDSVKRKVLQLLGIVHPQEWVKLIVEF